MTAVAVRFRRLPGGEIPDEGVGNEGVDVLSLAGQPVPAGGARLWVTAAEPRRGGEFTALFLPRQHPAACGGDVLVHVGPGGEPGETAARVAVWAVAAGSLSASRPGTRLARTCGRRPPARRSSSRRAR